LENTFNNNRAKFGGAAIAINGFSVDNLTNGNVSGSCPY
jgi:predicted outer membrane repeat protein